MQNATNEPTHLPGVIAAYFAADGEQDLEALRRRFHDDAVVHDEGQEYRGRDAIVAWKRTAQAKYRYIAEPLESSISGDAVLVRARVEGNFPGSPVELDYAFTLADGAITSLEVR